DVARKLVNDRRDTLTALIKDYQAYVDALQETNEVITRTRNEAIEYHRFLDERLLWLPSLGKLSLTDIPSEADAVRQFFVNHLQKWLKSFQEHWMEGLFFGMLYLFLLASRRKFYGRIEKAGNEAALRNCTTFSPTLQALGLSLVVALTLPVLLGGMAWMGDDESVSKGFTYAALFSGLIGFTSACSRPYGLFESHFRMERERTQLLHSHLKWFLPIMLPAVFLTVALTDVHSTQALGGSEVTSSEQGRLFFLWMMISIALLAVALLRPSKKFILHKGSPSPIAKLWLAIALIIPGCLFIGSALGFFTSMLTLRMLVAQSFWLIILTWIMSRLILRWVLVSRRRLAIEQALRRRESFLAERAKTPHIATAAVDETSPKPQAVPSLEEVKAEAVNVVEVEEQTARLTRAVAITAMALGLWAIWAPTLPALSVLDGFIIWPDSSETSTTSAAGSALSSTSLLTGSATATSNGTDVSSGISNSLPELIRPTSGGVSMQDVLVALVMLVLTTVAAKNVPGLLELTLLRRINLEPGGNFAFTTTIRYVIVIIGIVLAFGKIGISWSNVQWIAAAVTLGIGFGLQEIFANFVAGLILLFERPIRLGDVVTIGDASGKVTQIRIRATTILQFNNRELVVPNKELITGTLINWTLSDGILRIEVPVGIAYGSDTEKAREILLRLASENDRVLKDPKPDVLFTAFGDSALNFQLRAHVGSIVDMLPAKNELFFAVDHAFSKAGIEIAFPQTDIHIRSMPAELKRPVSPKPKRPVSPKEKK
ncbi:MAG: potassium efflux system protein, partial [Verrucomicrobiales bacterium]